jgi:hypothetical protein
MLRRLILTLTLAFLFGLGQQGVLVHPLSHLDDLASSSQQQDKSAHSVCDECLSHSVLAFVLDVAPFQAFAAQSGFEPHIHLAALPASHTPLSYQARAPPLFI